MIGLAALERLRLQRAAEHLPQLHPRAFAELLCKIVRDTVEMKFILQAAESYPQLNSVILRPAGGDRFPPRPLRRRPL